MESIITKFKSYNFTPGGDAQTEATGFMNSLTDEERNILRSDETLANQLWEAVQAKVASTSVAENKENAEFDKSIEQFQKEEKLQAHTGKRYIASPKQEKVLATGEETIQALIEQGMPSSEAVELVNIYPRYAKNIAMRGYDSQIEPAELPNIGLATLADVLSSSGRQLSGYFTDVPPYAYEGNNLGFWQSIARDPLLPAAPIGGAGVGTAKTISSALLRGAGTGFGTTVASDVLRQSGGEPGATPTEYGLTTALSAAIPAAGRGLSQVFQKGRLQKLLKPGVTELPASASELPTTLTEKGLKKNIESVQEESLRELSSRGALKEASAESRGVTRNIAQQSAADDFINGIEGKLTELTSSMQITPSKRVEAIKKLSSIDKNVREMLSKTEFSGPIEQVYTEEILALKNPVLIDALKAFMGSGADIFKFTTTPAVKKAASGGGLLTGDLLTIGRGVAPYLANPYIAEKSVPIMAAGIPVVTRSATQEWDDRVSGLSSLAQ